MKQPESKNSGPKGMNAPKDYWYSSIYKDELYGTPQSYSFTDVQASVIMPFQSPGQSPVLKLFGLTLVSISEHRDVYPVVSGGRRGIKGYTTGHSTIAGTLGFTIFGEGALADVLKYYARWRGDSLIHYLKPQELPPFDISLVFFSESGDAQTLLLRSVKLLDSSHNISISDIQFSEVYSFMAANSTYFIVDRDLKKYTPFDLAVPEPLKVNDFMDKKTVTAPTTTATTTTAATTEATTAATTAATTTAATTAATTTAATTDTGATTTAATTAATTTAATTTAATTTAATTTEVTTTAATTTEVTTTAGTTDGRTPDATT